MGGWRVFMLLAASLTGFSARAEQPVLVVPTLSGAVFDLAAQKGHAVIVNFWATWCVPCRAEMPMLSEFYRRHQSEGLVMIGISVDRPKDLPMVQKLAGTILYPVAVAADAKQNGFPAANALPVTFLIDAKGMLRGQVTQDQDGLSDARLTALMAPLLAESRP